MTMNEKIRLLRKEHGLTLEQVGDIVGVGKSTVRKWENGDIANMRRDKIAKLAEALQTTPAYLMGWDEPKAIEPDNVVEIRFLGEVAAGYGTIANEEYEYLKVPAHWLRGRPASDYFALRVKGSSMYPEYRDGDEVLCLSCSTMERSGQTGVIVYGDGEATLKKLEYVYGEDWLKLVPVNPEYETKIIRGEELEHCRVIGRAIKLIRDC